MAVYPRVREGTIAAFCIDASIIGLSPRVRGNRRGFVLHPALERSIPACAGEPDLPNPAPAYAEVYPRMCGGTLTAP